VRRPLSQLPFQANSFDVVRPSTSGAMVPDDVGALQEIHRVLVLVGLPASGRGLLRSGPLTTWRSPAAGIRATNWQEGRTRRFRGGRITIRNTLLSPLAVWSSSCTARATGNEEPSSSPPPRRPGPVRRRSRTMARRVRLPFRYRSSVSRETAARKNTGPVSPPWHRRLPRARCSIYPCQTSHTSISFAALFIMTYSVDVPYADGGQPAGLFVHLAELTLVHHLLYSRMSFVSSFRPAVPRPPHNHALERALRDAGEPLARLPRLIQYLPDQSVTITGVQKRFWLLVGASPHLFAVSTNRKNFRYSGRLLRTDRVPDDLLERRLFQFEPEAKLAIGPFCQSSARSPRQAGSCARY
jgi:hypothetical protein